MTLVPVLPCDRLRARDTYMQLGLFLEAERAEKGLLDDGWHVQSFASCRLAALEEAKPAFEAGFRAAERALGFEGCDESEEALQIEWEEYTAIRSLSKTADDVGQESAGAAVGPGAEMELYGWENGKPCYRAKGLGKVLSDALAAASNKGGRDGE